MAIKEGLEKATENMDKPCFVCEGNETWGFNLAWIAGQGCAVRVYDCPAEYQPVESDDLPAEQWLAAKVDPSGYVWPLDGQNAVKETQKFLWDAFTDSVAVGVKLDDLLSWPGLKAYYGLTQAQVSSVEAHYYQPEKWDKEDEKVRDIIADATDSEDFESLHSWLAWAVGDLVAADLVEDWENEE